MSPIQILKLVGFAAGAALYFAIVRLILKRRLGSRPRLNLLERCFVMLGLCLGIWFSGNLLTTLHALLLGTSRLTGLARTWDLITMIGVSLVPAALLHLHVAFWASMDNYRRFTERHVRIAGFIIYLPAVALPFAAYLILTGDYQPFFVRLRKLLVPYSVWYLSAFWSSAAIDWFMTDRFYKHETRERKFFKRLAAWLFLTGAFEFVVVAIRRSGPNDELWVVFILFSLLPAFAASYHVYRYKLAEVVIKDTLVYAAFATVFIAVYVYGVRYVDQWLVNRYQVTPGVIEVLLILGMVAVTPPLVRSLDQAVHRLFTREIGLYRDVVRQVSTGAAGFGELDSLIRYSEEVVRKGLDLLSVRIVSINSDMPPGPERRLAEELNRLELDVIDSHDELNAMGATAAYALRREGTMIGLLLVTAAPHTLTSEKRSILEVLASQVAVEVESCRLIEEKLRLERELSNRERLATLGQMAATVAHEVKNPLSAIKSIAQVMREEQALSAYDRDLSMIVSEIDRLNRTVSQLLAFSRPIKADAQPVDLEEMVRGTVKLFGSEANERGRGD